LTKIKTMISRDVVGSDDFLELSHEAQALYLQVNVECDGMGVIDSMKKVLRTATISDKALEELVSSGFLHGFEFAGKKLYIITHYWCMNNTQGKKTFFGQYRDVVTSLFTFASDDMRVYVPISGEVTSNLPVSLKIKEIEEKKRQSNTRALPSGGDGGNVENAGLQEALCPICRMPLVPFQDNGDVVIDCPSCNRVYKFNYDTKSFV